MPYLERHPVGWVADALWVTVYVYFGYQGVDYHGVLMCYLVNTVFL